MVAAVTTVMNMFRLGGEGWGHRVEGAEEVEALAEDGVGSVGVEKQTP